MNLTLTDDEARTLRDVLEQYLSNLREEVGKTERYEFREALKRDEASIKAMLDRLSTTPSARA